MAETQPASAPTQVRRPLTGSCRCGATRYVVFLNLPHVSEGKKGGQSLYRCNCTVCHKSGLFHVRVDSAPDDFLLLSPLDPLESLGDYRCEANGLHFFFCRTCGGRCITFFGEGEVVDVDLGEMNVPGYAAGKEGRVKAWRPKKDAWDVKEEMESYLSINGYSIDAKQDGWDLRELTESKSVKYLDYFRVGEEGFQQSRTERPHDHGAY